MCLHVRVTESETRRLVYGTTLALGLAAAWVLVQCLPLPLGFLTHPVWVDLATTIPVAMGHLSVSPIRTLSALPALILPGLIFLSTLILCQSARAAKRVWIMLSLLGAAIVVLSVLLEAYFPEVRFFSSYQVGFGSFSGVFVNRNVAAAFFGLTAFALAGTIQILNSETRAVPARPLTRAAILLALFWILLFVTLIAIIATRSRAGTMLNLPLLFLCLAIIYARKHHQRKTARMLVVLGGGFVLLVLFGEPVFSRLASSSQDFRQDFRWCAWASTFAVIQDNPWTGTGFATFIEVFPSYRDPVCLGTQGSWHRAHNSFLELALGLGLPAALILLALGYRLVLKSCVTGLRRRKSMRGIPILTLGALTFGSAHSLVDFPLQIPGVAAYFAALLAAGCAISILERGLARPKRRATLAP